MESEDQITIRGIALKDLLGLFEGQERLTIGSLGDTWHPADGFVDETYFKDIKTIDQFIKLNYDFRGLVIFDGRVNSLRIHFDSDLDQFNVTGDKEEIAKLRQVIESRG